MSLQSLSIGVSGLRSHQTRLDTVSNNIANSSTTAFKRQRAAFSEELGQEILGVGRTAGGSAINPSKVGRGVSVASIDRDFGQGSLNDTGIKTDLALNGDGFFIASPKSGAASDQRRLTRAGNFSFNQNGELVTANGLNVKGWEFDDSGTLDTGELKDVQFDPNAQSSAKVTEDISIGGNLSADLSTNGASPGETTSISTVVYDNQGESKSVTVEFERVQSRDEGDPTDQWEFTIEDGEGNVLDDPGGPPNGSTPNTLEFDADGNVTSVDGTGVNPNSPGTFEANFGWDINDDGAQETLSLAFGDETGGSVTQYSGSTTTTVTSQDGRSSGELAGFQFTPEGALELNYTNGVQDQLFQLAIGNVNNPNGLEQQGDNFFTTTSASGDLQLGQAGRDLQTSVVSGSLESSNVDLAKEFSDLIKAQRSYQASSQIITTADEVLNQTVQLKR
ncbi:flagellar hook protein FlgE [Salinibacter altiplanensis]|uniref:flagellar hook protein FlgE n=1 Tax=Salinibacter altiplanensis TaxID=1803181 RepID=UPI000C9F0775|nr:flagellar hook protein FlgE [Salinibacter altiplanensis]